MNMSNQNKDKLPNNQSYPKTERVVLVSCARNSKEKP